MIYKTISPTESQVGKYIDIYGDGIPEGVIFADLAVGGKGRYGNKHGSCMYEIPVRTKEFKDYVVIGKHEDNINGKQDVLTPILDGENRFYIMALRDFNNGMYGMFSWYEQAYHKIEDYNTLTKSDFGTGKQNTLTMIEKWNNEIYGAKNPRDIWNTIQNKINEGWFVPSTAEWATFAYRLNISSKNYEKKNMSNNYWTSHLCDRAKAYFITFYDECFSNASVISDIHIRLAKAI